MNDYKLMISGSVSARRWVTEFSRHNDAFAIEEAKSILQDSHIAAAAYTASLWCDNRCVGSWVIQHAIVLKDMTI